jgi:beta-glucosidase
MSAVAAGASGTLQSGAGTAGAIASTGGTATGTGGASGAGGAVTTTAGAGGTTAAGGMSAAGGAPAVVPFPSAACSMKTAALLAMMSRKEKAAQMVMAGNPDGSAPATADVTALAPGAVFSPGGASPPGGISPDKWTAMVDGYIAAAAASAHGIPILYGVDAVHGMNAASGTVIFPHNAGLGSTNDPALVEQVEAIAAQEVAAMGITWTFSPVVSAAWDNRWGRVYESFSEDPTLTGVMGAAATRGMQGASGLGTGKPGIVGCSKHWAGDGQASPPSAKGGIVDRGNILLNEADMTQFGIAPYLPALAAGLGSIMVSDATWMGASLSSHKHMITDLLKGMYGFKGFVATDWNAADSAGGPAAEINAGVDMLMQPGPNAGSWKTLIDTINNDNSISQARMDDAVTRILNVKCSAGLFGYKRDTALVAGVGSAEHRAVARKAVAESMVLLQNTGAVLPLAKATKVFVTGSGASSIANQCGGWSLSWQGIGTGTMASSNATTTGTTISQAIGKVGTVVGTQAAADVVVVVLSEKPYAEFLGDSATLNTPQIVTDLGVVDAAHQAGKKVVAVVLSGRPIVLTAHVANADAWIAAWLPGTEGDGVADVLYGTVKPTGKLSHSFPKADAMPNIHAAGYTALFPFGFGLSYP